MDLEEYSSWRLRDCCDSKWYDEGRVIREKFDDDDQGSLIERYKNVLRRRWKGHGGRGTERASFFEGVVRREVMVLDQVWKGHQMCWREVLAVIMDIFMEGLSESLFECHEVVDVVEGWEKGQSHLGVQWTQFIGQDWWDSLLKEAFKGMRDSFQEAERKRTSKLLSEIIEQTCEGQFESDEEGGGPRIASGRVRDIEGMVEKLLPAIKNQIERAVKCAGREGERANAWTAGVWGDLLDFLVNGICQPWVKHSRTLCGPGASQPSVAGVGKGVWDTVSGVKLVCRSVQDEIWNFPDDGVVDVLLRFGGVTELTVAKARRVRWVKSVERLLQSLLKEAVSSVTDQARLRMLDWNSGKSSGPYFVREEEEVSEEELKPLWADMTQLREQGAEILGDRDMSKVWEEVIANVEGLFIDRIYKHFRITSCGSIIIKRDLDGLRSIGGVSGAEGAAMLPLVAVLFASPKQYLSTAVKSMVEAGWDEKDVAKMISKREDCVADIKTQKKQGAKQGAEGLVKKMIADEG